MCSDSALIDLTRLPRSLEADSQSCRGNLGLQQVLVQRGEALSVDLTLNEAVVEDVDVGEGE